LLGFPRQNRPGGAIVGGLGPGASVFRAWRNGYNQVERGADLANGLIVLGRREMTRCAEASFASLLPPPFLLAKARSPRAVEKATETSRPSRLTMPRSTPRPRPPREAAPPFATARGDFLGQLAPVRIGQSFGIARADSRARRRRAGNRRPSETVRDDCPARRRSVAIRSRTATVLGGWRARRQPAASKRPFGIARADSQARPRAAEQ
jgi:hypothetical protein